MTAWHQATDVRVICSACRSTQEPSNPNAFMVVPVCKPLLAICGSCIAEAAAAAARESMRRNATTA